MSIMPMPIPPREYYEWQDDKRHAWDREHAPFPKAPLPTLQDVRNQIDMACDILNPTLSCRYCGNAADEGIGALETAMAMVDTLLSRVGR